MILCIDTATEQPGVAIIGSKTKSNFLPLDKAHTSDNILKKIDQLIKTADIHLSDLKGIFVVKGPGSFTGLRVGISVANQFAHQLDIPIIGLLTDELYFYKTKVKDFFYLQSMNTDQVYMVGFGKYKEDFPKEIVSVSECHHELTSQAGAKWLGHLNEKHLYILSDIERITDLFQSDKVWAGAVADYPLKPTKKYDLIEPFYAKEPTITISKRNLN